MKCARCDNHAPDWLFIILEWYAIEGGALCPECYEKTLPNIMDLKGIAPNATGKRSSEEFVRDRRDKFQAELDAITPLIWWLIG